MKIGIFLSAAVVVLFVMLLLLNRGEPPTPPTKATSADRLKAQTPPADAPILHTPADPDASADAIYEQAWQYFENHRSELTKDTVAGPVAQGWADLFVRAAAAGQVSPGFLDRQTPMTPAASSPIADALYHVGRVVLTRGQTLYDEGRKDEALQIGRAVWALGLRGYTKNVRIRPRFFSLFNMDMSLNALRDWLAEDDPDQKKIARWDDLIRGYNDVFNKKAEMLMTVSPNIGDVIRIARSDEDPTFRLEATLKLGVLQHAPRTRSNLKLMEQTFAANARDKHPAVAEAAKAAAGISVEQVQKMR